MCNHNKVNAISEKSNILIRVSLKKQNNCQNVKTQSWLNESSQALLIWHISILDINHFAEDN